MVTIRHGLKHHDLAIEAVVLNWFGAKLSTEHREACRVNKIDLENSKLLNGQGRFRELDFALMDKPALERESRALSALAGAGGGFLVAEPSYVGIWEQALTADSAVRRLATIERPTKGNLFRIPLVDDTANTGHLVAENVSTASTDVVFSQIILNARKYTSDRLVVPHELVEDAGPELVRQLLEVAARRISRRQNKDFTVGVGVSAPVGLVTAAALSGATVAAASSSVISTDDVANLWAATGDGYLDSPNLAFMAARGTFQQMRKFKDSTGRPAFDFDGDTLEGVPIVYNRDMPAVGSGSVSLMLGSFDHYRIADWSVRLMEYPEAHADLDQLTIEAFQRSDGNLLDAGTHPVAGLVT